ncbi:hypothetical protein HDU82_007266 [Entophlyctis luteolus]|nr:hypothetical protein HDU82_007266 [Entophlyctis luteolus]
MDERLKKLEQLKKLRTAALKDNRKDVHVAHEKSKRNHGQDIKTQKTRREAEILAARADAEDSGVDYERVRAFSYSVESVERYSEKEEAREKRIANVAFSDYTQAAANKYEKLTDALARTIDKKQYSDAKLVASIASEASSTAAVDKNALAYAALDNTPSQQSVAKLVKDVEKQTEVRKTFSKRRAYNPDDDVTYINERNMRFNKKIARAYDKHTEEIKAAFERGTAL